MWRHDRLADAELFRLLRKGEITYAGNRRLKIYGRLDCWSGQRMRRVNRVFFVDEAEAVTAGYRPCGHCMRQQAV